MNKIFKNKRNTKFRSATKKVRKRLFIKDLKKNKFKKRRNKKVLQFLHLFDFKIDKHNALYIYTWILLVIFIGVGLVVFGPYFKVQTINIVRQDNLSNINIAYKSLENIRGTHIMLNDKLSIEKNIKNYQENIQNVEISKNLPDKLDIAISSYKPLFNTEINGKNYIIVENGSFIPEKKNPDIRDLTILSKKRSSSIPDYKKIIDVKYLQQIVSIYNEIKINIIRIQVKDIIYYPIEREVIVSIGWWAKLIFDLESPVIPQVKRLAIFDTENIKIDTASMMYIDLRIKDKVFYCTTETEYQCIVNLKNIYPEKIEK